MSQSKNPEPSEIGEYIEIKNDLRNLDDIIRWCRENDDICKQLAKNAKAFYHKYLTQGGVFDYLETIINKMLLAFGLVSLKDTNNFSRRDLETLETVKVIENMKPRTQVESRRLSMAKQQLKEIKKMARKMQEQLTVLEERVNVLEEIKEDIDNGKTNS